MNHRYMVVLGHYWGRGRTDRVAIANARDSGFGESNITEDNLLGVFRVEWDPEELPEDVSSEDVEDNFYVDRMGGVNYPAWDAVDYEELEYGEDRYFTRDVYADDSLKY